MSVTNAGGAAGYLSPNVIINGAFDVWQRGTSFSGGGQYTADRWQSYAVQSGKLTYSQSATAPTGFKYSWLATSTSAYTPVSGDYFMQTQRIEGFNTASFAFGTGSAKTLTLSFWVRSSLTGTFGGALHNNAFDRSYVFSYTISSANTWEYKTITIVGDTAGTWDNSTAVGLEIGFSLGAHSTGLTTAGSWVSGAYWGVTGQVNVVSTNAATWQVTGVQLESGITATPFRRNANSIQGELAACQRYYWRSSAAENPNTMYGFGFCASTTSVEAIVHLPVTMRVKPTSIDYLNICANDANTSLTASSVVINQGSPSVVNIGLAVTGATQYRPTRAIANGTTNSYLGFSAEL